jgi:hypothetical protein
MCLDSRFPRFNLISLFVLHFCKPYRGERGHYRSSKPCSPHALRDKKQSEQSYKRQIFNFLESIIKCELPEDTSIIEEHDGRPMQRSIEIQTSSPTAVPSHSLLVLHMPPTLRSNQCHKLSSIACTGRQSVSSSRNATGIIAQHLLEVS